MSALSKESRRWCHCGVVCRVPRQVSRTTYYQHRKLVRAQSDDNGSGQSNSAEQGPKQLSKQLRATGSAAAENDVDDGDDSYVDMDLDISRDEPVVS